MKLKLACALALAIFGLIPAARAEAKSCKSEVPKEAFKFFGESDPASASCEDYVYRLVDLNGDERDDVIIYRKQISCNAKGTCDSEIFLRLDNKFTDVGTLPGSWRLLDTKTDRFTDISVLTQNGQVVVYKWNGRQYQPETYAIKKPETPTPAKHDPWSSLP